MLQRCLYFSIRCGVKCPVRWTQIILRRRYQSAVNNQYQGRLSRRPATCRGTSAACLPAALVVRRSVSPTSRHRRRRRPTVIDRSATATDRRTSATRSDLTTQHASVCPRSIPARQSHCPTYDVIAGTLLKRSKYYCMISAERRSILDRSSFVCVY